MWHEPIHYKLYTHIGYRVINFQENREERSPSEKKQPKSVPLIHFWLKAKGWPWFFGVSPFHSKGYPCRRRVSWSSYLAFVDPFSPFRVLQNQLLHRFCVCVWRMALVKVENSWGFPGGSMVKNLPAIQETRVRALGWEDPLEEGMAWRIPWTEEPGRLQSMGLQRVRHAWVTNTHTQRTPSFCTWGKDSLLILEFILTPETSVVPHVSSLLLQWWDGSPSVRVKESQLAFLQLSFHGHRLIF